ncbi:MAG: hypothetical protein QOD99_1586 [Chthoniobacter sp.]|jgi:membrane-bound ClpP family serine protease|nr:hypothetical protein [Chthoniobacter sp.]
MKPAGTIGIILIVLGVIALAYQGFSYRQRETVLDLGPIHATAERERTVPIPPIIGIVAVVGGIVLLVSATKKS